MDRPIESFRDLVAWQKTFALGLEVYRITRPFPAEERYGLVSQMRRCAVSIPSNIAEGYGRESRTDYIRYLKIARGSLLELETQLMFSGELGYCEQAATDSLVSQTNECGRILNGLIRSLAK